MNSPGGLRSRRSLRSRQFFFNRELSLLEFHARVLEEALDDRNPLLERLKFLSIFSSNLDEFFMIRVSGLKEELENEVNVVSADGLTPADQLARTRERVLLLDKGAGSLFARRDHAATERRGSCGRFLRVSVAS